MPAKRSFFLPVILTLSLFVAAAAKPNDSQAGTTPLPAGSDVLMVMNNTPSTTADFVSWWQFWKEKDTPFPDTPDPYIDWLLLVREAEMMELYRRPEYQQKLDTYLQARSILILREEEVETHIKKDDETNYAFYAKNFAPRWRIIPRFFPGEKEAAEWKKSDAAKNRNQLAHSPNVHVMGRWYRPTTLPEDWKQAVNAMKPGELSGVMAADAGVVILDLLEQAGADRQDFASIRETVEEASYKAQKIELTGKLLDRLMPKFHVMIDREVMAAIDLSTDNAAIADKILVTSDKAKFTVRDFVLLAKKNAPMNPARENEETRKEQMIRNILAHNLVNWEAIDRHYEQRPPFSENYRFYKGHRLIRELENAVLLPQVNIEKDAIDKYYRDNTALYQGPVQVTYATVDGNAATIREIWVNSMQGKSFQSSVKAVTGEEPASKSEPVGSLAPALAEAIAKLSPGELSKPLKNEQDQSRLVFLIDRKQQPTKPLDSVKADIRQALLDKGMQQAREKLLADLRKKTSITIEKATWLNIHQHYTGK